MSLEYFEVSPLVPYFNKVTCSGTGGTISRDSSTYTRVSTVALVRPTGIIIISILYLVIAPAVPYCHYSSSWCLHLYPSVIMVLSVLVGFPGTLVSL